MIWYDMTWENSYGQKRQLCAYYTRLELRIYGTPREMVTQWTDIDGDPNRIQVLYRIATIGQSQLYMKSSTTANYLITKCSRTLISFD